MTGKQRSPCLDTRKRGRVKAVAMANAGLPDSSVW